MARSDDDRFRVVLRGSKQRAGPGPSRFVTKVLRQISRAGHLPGGRRSQQPVGRRSRLHRGATAVHVSGTALDPRSRRVIVKTRLVRLKGTTSGAIATHLRYLVRDGVAADGTPGRAYDAAIDDADVEAFKTRGLGDRHQFRLIVSPEDAVELHDLRSYTRQLMGQLEVDLETKLEWAAVDHWDTDHPHTHVVLRGVDQHGRDLVIDGGYLTRGIRQRGAELATQWLGPRTELEIRRTQEREVQQDRWTGLDQTLSRHCVRGVVDLSTSSAQNGDGPPLQLQIGRLQHLQRLGLAERLQDGRWTLKTNAESVLRTLGERGDVIRTMQRAFGRESRPFAISKHAASRSPVLGRVMAKGLADELTDRPYVIVDGVDGRGHYVVLGAGADVSELPVGSIAEFGIPLDRVADRRIAALAVNGVYRVDAHRAQLASDTPARHDPEEILAGHVRRLEALRRAGLVERLRDGLWRVPADLAARGRAYDQAHSGEVTATLHCHLPIERQVRAIGVTWLDRQLAGEQRSPLATQGFGATVRKALDDRGEFLMEQGLATRRFGRAMVSADVLKALRDRDLGAAAEALKAESGLPYRPASEGRVDGIYRRSVTLVTGRFAMVDDGLGFTLVPWNSIIETRLGQRISAVVRGSHVYWQLGRQNGR